MIFITSVSSGETVSEEVRWYSSEQVETGRELFSIHCSSCHGKRAEGTRNWRQRLEDGSLPPPPLNGTAHSWHHQLPVLRKAINEGGQSFGGKMPGFKDKLSAKQVDAVIAWFQSLWSDEIYAMWSGEGIETIEQPPIIRDLLEGL
ncbi:MAG: c-type cytochrome [Chromatiales bacterium]|nr:c-type cytochrome [Chromatiales bacterium]